MLYHIPCYTLFFYYDMQADKGWEKVKDAGEQIKQQAGKMKEEAMDRPPVSGKDRKGPMGEVPDKV